ncbi:MAG: hypothetical protein ACKVP5_21125 [Aestuariivirga sp.]
MTEPRNPRLVLLASIVPGAGHVLLGQAQRGLIFIFFMAILGWVSVKLMPDHATFIGRHIGGVFIYGISIIDAYRRARVSWEAWRYAQENRSPPASPPRDGG